MDAVIAAAAGHQRRDHHFRSHLERLAHEVLGEFVAAFDDHAADFMTERERPRQRLRPMSLQNVQVRAADAARADLDQRGLFADLWPWHAADDRLAARSRVGADADLVHGCFLDARFCYVWWCGLRGSVFEMRGRAKVRSRSPHERSGMRDRRSRISLRSVRATAPNTFTAVILRCEPCDAFASQGKASKDGPQALAAYPSRRARARTSG
ncbi:hypothetical protein ACVWYI_005664 [Bradyrhizobium sp. LB13.1]